MSDNNSDKQKTTTKLKTVLKSQGRTQKYLLAELQNRGWGIDHPQLCRYINGDTTPRKEQDFYTHVAEILSVDLSDLYSPKTDEVPQKNQPSQEEETPQKPDATSN